MKQKRKGIGYLILILLLMAAVGISCLGLQAGKPSASTQGSAVSAMLLSDSRLFYDEERIAAMAGTDINPAEQTDEPSEQEKDEDTPASDVTEQATADSGLWEETGLGQDNGDIENGSANAGSTNAGALSQLPGIGSGETDSDTGDGGEESFEAEAGDAYFTTSIIDQDLVTVPEYYFTLTHLQPQLQPVGISVICNDQEAEYRGSATSFQLNLELGKNIVTVKVMYQQENDYITAFQSYTIYYAAGDEILIITDLEQIHSVATADLNFYAYGQKGENRLRAVVSVNGKKITGTDDTYTAKLVYGTNTIKITAGGRQDTVSKTYTVVYQEEQFKITTSISDTVITNDTKQKDYEREEQTVYGDTEEYRFCINLNQESGLECIERVRSQSAVVPQDGDGYYTVTLSPRKGSYLYIYYRDSDGVKQCYKYLLRFKRNPESTPEDHYPTIYAQVEIGNTVMNLDNGMTFKTPDIITNITAFSWNNEQLYYNNYQVSVNGQVLSQHSYQTGTWFGYDTYLTVEGANTISVTVTDYDGYSVTKSWTVYYEKGDITVTVSVEATTVGLGYLVPPTAVTVPGGTNAMDIVCGLLEERGYGYSNTGGTYLASISKAGICNGYSIDPELMELIILDGMDATGSGTNPVPASMDNLGEFDFYRYSGWMYSYNGNYPGYGMNVCKPQDGSVIRVRYTLALGKDIGGFSGSMSGDYGAVSGNYDREW